MVHYLPSMCGGLGWDMQSPTLPGDLRERRQCDQSRARGIAEERETCKWTQREFSWADPPRLLKL